MGDEHSDGPKNRSSNLTTPPVGGGQPPFSRNVSNDDRQPSVQLNPKPPDARAPQGITFNHTQRTVDIPDNTWLPGFPYQVRGRVTCENEELYAIEAVKPLSGYTGLCPICQRRHVPLSPSRGYYATSRSLYDKLVSAQSSETSLQELRCERNKLPPLKKPLIGKNIGIQGESNSCYLDATLYCMFAYNDVFDKLIYSPEVKNNPHSDEQDSAISNVQTLLRDNIAHVLRSGKGYVRREAILHLRQQLGKATKDQTFSNDEKDPTEFLRACEKLFHYSPIKTIQYDEKPKDDYSNITSNFIWECFDDNIEKKSSTNVQTLFTNSLRQFQQKLAGVPPFLILVAPRHSRTERSYKYITPDLKIRLDDDLVQLCCLKCGVTAKNSEKEREFFHCPQCSLEYVQDSMSKVMCFCLNCVKEIHTTPEQLVDEKHSVKQIGNKALNKQVLELFAVLCIEKSHYVAFVKCKASPKQHFLQQTASQGENDQWLFFDSMSDRIDDQINIPSVSHAESFEEWIATAVKYEEKFFRFLDDQRKSTQYKQSLSTKDIMQLRLFRDGAFFFYECAQAIYT
ncbi:unnamed protein product [Didymodactylos carnosus]|uniref:USP domain-containing protein n=1 Tax=Didymodactylos carnosus TaxID=1234261 RepID=A0A813X9L7_9BILA|nr:unnamed protein product [Didymodactylos carnosus]CAF0887158.1 unnamed protein product [Didymodactylos carnosus]CAF3652587.1 unnamed protein product [Didymodactylos carnosus]CAF3670050.1 unnamed protein product [Didymodactylos carnosus]